MKSKILTNLLEWLGQGFYLVLASLLLWGEHIKERRNGLGWNCHSKHMVFFFFNFFFMNKKCLTRMIIDSARLNPLLMVWGTFEHIRIIHIVAQHFCEVHDSNLATPELISVTKFETPTNAPHFQRPKIWPFENSMDTMLIIFPALYLSLQ